MTMRLLLSVLALLWAATAPAESLDLYTMPEGVQSRLSSFENLDGAKASGGSSNRGAKGHAFESLQAGQSRTLLDVAGPGIIQRMWFTVRDRSPEMLRALRLQMFWDGADKPAVDVPLGDFFGFGLSQVVAQESALFSSPEGRSFNSYVAMPFKSGARVVLTNESKTDLPLLFFDIDFVQLEHAPQDMLYFHAYWSRQKTSPLGKDFELLPRTVGKGRFLGATIGVNTDPVYADTWFGEGEVKMYIDGDVDHPSINGTGTEDYIGTGWGQGTYSNRYQGCTVADAAKGRYAFYRFHIPDQIYFHQDIRVTLQQMGGADLEQVRALHKRGAPLRPVSVATDAGFVRLLELSDPPALTDARFPQGWVNFYRVDDYSATSYFYLDRPSSKLPPLAAVQARMP